jgi:hypothetical protein
MILIDVGSWIWVALAVFFMLFYLQKWRRSACKHLTPRFASACVLHFMVRFLPIPALFYTLEGLGGWFMLYQAVFLLIGYVLVTLILETIINAIPSLSRLRDELKPRPKAIVPPQGSNLETET